MSLLFWWGSLKDVEIFLDEDDGREAPSCRLLFFLRHSSSFLLVLSRLGGLLLSCCCLHRAALLHSWSLLLCLLHRLSGCRHYYLLPLWYALQITVIVWVVVRGVRSSQLLSDQTLTLIKSLLERATDDTLWGGAVLHHTHHRRMRLLLRLNLITSCYKQRNKAR